MHVCSGHVGHILLHGSWYPRQRSAVEHRPVHWLHGVISVWPWIQTEPRGATGLREKPLLEPSAAFLWRCVRQMSRSAFLQRLHNQGCFRSTDIVRLLEMKDRLFRLPMPVLPVHNHAGNGASLFQINLLKNVMSRLPGKMKIVCSTSVMVRKYLGCFLCLGVSDCRQTPWLPAYGMRLFAKLAHPHLMTLYNFGSLI